MPRLPHNRTTLHRIEAGEPSVAAGAYWATVAALGLRCGIVELPTQAGKVRPLQAIPSHVLPEHVNLNFYPQLKLLAWHVQGVQLITPRQAWDIYVRNWRHIETAKVLPIENQLIELLRAEFEGRTGEVPNANV